MTPDEIDAARTEAIRQASEQVVRLEDATNQLIRVVEERARQEGGMAGAEQAAAQVAEVALAASDAVEQARVEAAAMTRRAALRMLSGMSVFMSVGLATPPASWWRVGFIGVSLVVAAGLWWRAD